MNSRHVRTLTAAAAVLTSLFTAGVASAQRVTVQYGGPGPQYGAPPPGYGAPPPAYGPGYAEADGPRFRGGVTLNGGGLIVPGVVNIGTIGIQGQLGAQISNNWGVYAIPSFDVIVGKVGGVGIGAGLLAEYTFDGIPISVGAGPEAGLFAAIGASGCNTQGTACSTASTAGGVLWGGRLRFAFHPVIVRQGIRRRSFTLGVDVRMLTGAFGATSETNTTATASASVNSFALSPVLWLGYQAF